MNSNKPNMLEAALDYARQGFKVLPLCYPTPDGKCGCGWKHKDKEIGKAPRTMHGLSDASSDPNQIREWWKQCPEANIGLLTEDLTVGDFDAEHGGLESKVAMEAKYGPLPLTRTHRTGGGGLHYIYRNPYGRKVKSIQNLGGYQGIDRKADGGYIVMPPSLHKSGNRYEVMDDAEIAPTPEWLLEMATEQKPASDEEKGAIKALDGVPEGERDVAIYKYACRLFGKGLSKDEVTHLVLLAASRCTPPLSEKEALAKVESAAKYERTPRQDKTPEIMSARELSDIDYPDLIFALPDMICEGFSEIAGRPKSAKSIWALEAAYSVALGKNLFDGSPCEKGRALYMGLEDGERRLQYRISKLNASYAKVSSKSKEGGSRIKVAFYPFPDGLDITTHWPKIGDGGIEELEAYLDKYPDTRLIVVDITKRMMKKKGKGMAYDEDYESIQPLQELATRRRVAILGVHHTRKALSDDPVEMVSGTYGRTGAADSVIVVRRVTKNESKFSFTGRDIKERELAMRFDEERLRWTSLGDADIYFMSGEREDILGCLLDNGSMSPSEIAKTLERGASATKTLLSRMLRDGVVTKDPKGKYSARRAK